ncbi:MAG: DMT family transporter [Candidatus Cohnella colombiensis]|uniref:DMT family transporter n=1 Tax=Candidatus Cohnella colombiensis TaxID=3121368 RepID=A0AA95F051_9BACL|nr:MAG: DMT family transporter [Cohnella sp.]
MWLIYALSAALCFGLRAILYQISSQKPLDRNLMLLGVFTLGAIVTFTANFFVMQPWNSGALIGVFMGISSYLANSSLYKGFAVGKPSLVAIFTALPPAVVLIVAYILWNETINHAQISSFVLIMLGILIIRYTNDLTLSDLKGIQWAVIAMLAFAITDLSSKQSQLLGGGVLPTLSLMFITGTVLFFFSWWRQRELVNRSSVKMWSARRTFLWGMIVGTTHVSGMILVLPAFKLGATGLVSAVLAANVLLFLLFSRFYLKEQFTRLQLLGISLAFIGVMLLRLLE